MLFTENFMSKEIFAFIYNKFYSKCRLFKKKNTIPQFDLRLKSNALQRKLCKTRNFCANLGQNDIFHKFNIKNRLLLIMKFR